MSSSSKLFSWRDCLVLIVKISQPKKKHNRLNFTTIKRFIWPIIIINISIIKFTLNYGEGKLYTVYIESQNPCAEIRICLDWVGFWDNPSGIFFVFEINITGGIENLFLRVLSRVQYSFHKSDVYFLGTHPSLILTNWDALFETYIYLNQALGWEFQSYLTVTCFKTYQLTGLTKF